MERICPELKFANAVSLYIHYPFCVHKCPYCDFASTEQNPSAARDELYIQALCAEFYHKLQLLGSTPITSVYLGGGTPSLCSLESLQQLLQVIKPYLSSDAEVSLEVNPGTVSKERLQAYRNMGFNRISIGVQSFNDLALKRLGRIHDRKAALDAVTWALSIFDNVNVDLMHGLPKQTLEEALADILEIIALKPQHISWYELTIEEDTAFGRKPPVLPDEEILADIEEQGGKLLDKAGYEHYEVSGYNFGGKYRCRHNMNYWVYGDYLGIGVAAHQKITRLSPLGQRYLDESWRQQPQSVTQALLQLTAVDPRSKGLDADVTKQCGDEGPVGALEVGAVDTVGIAGVAGADAAVATGVAGAGANGGLLQRDNLGLFEIYRRANIEDYVQYIDEQLALAQAHLKLSLDRSSLAAQADARLLQTARNNAWPFKISTQSYTAQGSLKLSFIAGEPVDNVDIPFEYMLNRMRLWDDYWAPCEYHIHSGCSSLKSIQYPLMLLSHLGLIELKSSALLQSQAAVARAIYYAEPSVPLLRPSSFGKRMLNEILEAFLPDSEEYVFDAQRLQAMLQER